MRSESIIDTRRRIRAGEHHALKFVSEPLLLPLEYVFAPPLNGLGVGNPFTGKLCVPSVGGGVGATHTNPRQFTKGTHNNREERDTDHCAQTRSGHRSPSARAQTAYELAHLLLPRLPEQTPTDLQPPKSVHSLQSAVGAVAQSAARD